MSDRSVKGRGTEPRFVNQRTLDGEESGEEVRTYRFVVGRKFGVEFTVQKVLPNTCSVLTRNLVG